jgi:hypothetical protein
LCEVCAWSFHDKTPAQARVWDSLAERLRGRMRSLAGYTKDQYERDIRQARQDLRDLPLSKWREKWDTRRGPQGRPPNAPRR